MPRGYKMKIDELIHKYGKITIPLLQRHFNLSYEGAKILFMKYNES